MYDLNIPQITSELSLAAASSLNLQAPLISPEYGGVVNTPCSVLSAG